MTPELDACRIPNWYPRLSTFSLPTSFVALNELEIAALAAGETADSPVSQKVLPRLEKAMSRYGYNRFLSVDLAAPKDSRRFAEKRGAVRSAKSAWNVLADSEIVRASAQRGEVSCICVRPFRRMDHAREFRLFIKDGKLFAMSQYWLDRHYPKMQKYARQYWAAAVSFIGENIWAFPLKDIVADIYFTSDGEILVMDLNPLAPETDPLMFNNWSSFDWTGEPAGLLIVPEPRELSGDVNVSF